MILMQDYNEKQQVEWKEIENLHFGKIKKRSARKFDAALKVCGEREPIIKGISPALKRPSALYWNNEKDAVR